MGNNYCNYCLNAAFCENACADYNDYLADTGELSLFRQTGLTPDEITALRAENVYLKNCVDLTKYHLGVVAEQRREAAHLINAIDSRLSTWGASQRAVIDDALIAIRCWRKERPPRTNFAAITESPAKLAKAIVEAEYEGFCLDLPECNVPIEIREYSTINCKQCLVDWLNRSVDEQKKE